NYSQIFQIPPDNDDSSVNIALGQRIYASELVNEEIKQKWYKHNFHIKGYYDKVKQYSYNPFLNNTIDTRTYYAFSKFFNYLKQNNRTETSYFFTTWILDFSEEKKDVMYIPLHVNNVDVSVNANILYGLNNFLIWEQNITLIEDVFDQKLQNMYILSAELIHYVLQNNLTETHPDIIMLYYPSINDFYWFIARNVYLLNSFQPKKDYKVINQARQILTEAMRKYVTPKIISEMKKDDKDNSYWDQFLGNYANKTRGEDRNFATIMNLNAIIDSWTIGDKKERSYIKETTKELKQIIKTEFKIYFKKTLSIIII
ncbi:hypothetical protein IMG5_186070, partial [Ichthyophthirius multifiliis]